MIVMKKERKLEDREWWKEKNSDKENSTAYIKLILFREEDELERKRELLKFQKPPEPALPAAASAPPPPNLLFESKSLF